MDLNDAVLTCGVNLQWMNVLGVIGRKLTYKIATLRLIRNDIRELFIELTTDKSKPLKFRMKNIIMHKKFMSEGKASINFKTENCVMYISNAPPAPLMYFLRTVFIKINGNEQIDEIAAQKQLRAHMLSEKPSIFEEVSPVTTSEMVLARKKAGLITKNTPLLGESRKRKYEEIRNGDGLMNKAPAAKRLYQESPQNDLKAEDSIKLCTEQMEVLRACTSGKNVFFTGSAGTGKSFLLRKIISALPPDGTVSTASTGVAACLISGVTLHGFAGIGSGEASLQRCYELASRPSSAQAWRKCKRLIIDEISMVDGEFFDKIEAVARHVRRNDRPFGGIQLILCGDFLQLPPVTKRNPTLGNVDAQQQRFCFQSNAWEKCIEFVFELKDVHRQSDPEFIKILNHIRIGHVNEGITKRLIATSKQIIESNGILATQLCSHTNDADCINETKLENLAGEKVLFKAEDSDAHMTKQLDAQVQVTSELYLKVNAQVMLLKNVNISSGLVNGARGVVVRIEKGLPVVRFKNNMEYTCKQEKWIIKTPSGGTVTRRQVPLKLAWAFSIHKSQGLTLDCVEMSLSKVFEAGQAYVALSRAKSLDSLRILDFDAKQVWANAHVLQYYKLFRRRLQNITMIPLGSRTTEGKERKTAKNANSLDKLKKSLMNKPLVSITQITSKPRYWLIEHIINSIGKSFQWVASFRHIYVFAVVDTIAAGWLKYITRIGKYMKSPELRIADALKRLEKYEMLHFDKDTYLKSRDTVLETNDESIVSWSFQIRRPVLSVTGVP
uniref:ATP-dependent DNA helicase PIF1 n=1 Tax=Glossina palpalis gambiensis TaxID=67801 RepID=A0A1B0B7Q8_9MUSC